jgi:hypothetical protein
MINRFHLIIFLCVAATFVGVSSRAGAQGNVIGIDQFNGWIFNRMQNEQNARDTFHSRIDLEIQQLELVAALTEDEKAKIRLAGKGDVKRFFDNVHEARRKFLALGDVNQNQMNEAYQLASPLAQRINRGLFDDNSLLKKVAATAPGPERAERIRKRNQRRRQFQTEANIKSYIAMLGRSVPLTSDQRDQLVDLVSSKVDLAQFDAPYVTYLISYRLSQLPDGDLQTIFDQNQWQAFENTLVQAKAMKAVLKQQGLIDDK